MHAIPQLHLPHIDPRALLAGALALAVALLLALAPSVPDIQRGGGPDASAPAAIDQPARLSPTPYGAFSFRDPLASPLAELDRPAVPR